MLVPLILVFAMYVQFHGDFGPGGGFQAGVAAATAIILYALVFGIPAGQRVAPLSVVLLMIPLGVLIFAGTGVASILLGGNYLNYSVLSEEAGEINNDDSFRWIIDPIDGTSNFLHGIPHFAISVGLEHNKEIISGIVYDPIKDEMFVAEKGNGSYMNNQRMRVSARSKIKNCIIFSGGPRYESENKELTFKEYIKFSSKVDTAIRKLGCASLDMAYVAAGRCDGFWQRDLNYWDIAAGIILVKESGGYVTDFKGKNEYIENKTILVTNSKINNEMIEVLK